LEDELSKSVKTGSEVDCPTLMKMGFQKSNNVWVSKNENNANIPSTSNTVEDVLGAEMNALVAYVPPVDRSEPLSRFEKFVIHKLDTW